MSIRSWVAWSGAPFGIASAALFGASTPLAKALLGGASGRVALFGFGPGVGVGVDLGTAPAIQQRGAIRAKGLGLDGVGGSGRRGCGSTVLMIGLVSTPASSAALLLNLEGLATMAIAWAVFHENVDRRLLLGALAILAGAVHLSWQGTGGGLGWGTLAIAGACLA